VTLRLPLGTLFDGRDYIFVTESNVRGYEWTTKETDILLDDLMDAALGNLGGKQHDNTDNVDGDGEPVVVANNVAAAPSVITDYELSQIVLVPTSDWDSNLLGLGNRYDVYDGQQRLVTLNLLLAGLRDSFQSEADKGKGGGKRAVALAATANEISGMLMPTKVRKEDVMRITLRKRDNVLLDKILVGDNADDEGETAAITSLPTKSYSKMTAKGKSQLLSSLSPANTRIFQNFVHLSNRLALLTTRERLRLLDYIVERVYLLVCIPETSRIARNIVMSQGRKGMDNEPVDDFKGLVCFRYTLEEEDMYQTFDRWDALAAEPSSVTSGSSSVSSMDGADPAGSSIKSVGRDIISSACVLRASAALRMKIRSRGGGDEVYAWERWLRQELWSQNQRLSQPREEQQSDSATTTKPALQPWQGKDFFVEEIEPASIALYKFRTGQWDEFAFLSKTRKLTKKQRDTTIARLNFLRDIAMGVASAKETEIVVLELLLRAERDGTSGSSMLSRYLDEILPLIEKWTLWMALTRPSPMQRHASVFALLDTMDDFDSVGSLGLEDVEMIKSLRESMDEYDFGATAGGKRLAAAILKRMSTHLMVEEKKNIPGGTNGGTNAATVDLIQQNWPSEEEREEWSNRIGNLALVSSAPPRNSRAKKGSDSSWESKSKRFKKEPWLLTRQLAESDEWDMGAVQNQQKDLLKLMDSVWSLGE